MKIMKFSILFKRQSLFVILVKIKESQFQALTSSVYLYKESKLRSKAP